MTSQRTATKLFEILLAEDNSADVLLVRRALKGHQVQCVLHVMTDGAQAINWITNVDNDPKAATPDLMLLDMHLPKHDGADILSRLRSTERLAQTPVVVMTSMDSDVIEGQATKNAAMFYFRKPSSLNEFMQLGSIVKSLLSGGADSVDAALKEKEAGGQP